MNRLRLAVVLCFGVWVAPALGTEPNEVGARLWKAKCAQCHGTDGKGTTKQGLKMGVSDATTAQWQKEMTDQKFRDTLSSGIKRERNGKKQEMDPLGKELKPEQFDALIGYVRSLAAPPAPAPVTKK